MRLRSNLRAGRLQPLAAVVSLVPRTMKIRLYLATLGLGLSGISGVNGTLQQDVSSFNFRRHASTIVAAL